MRVSFGLVDPGGELVSSDERVRVQFGPDKGQMTSDEMIFTGHAGESDHDIALSDHEHLPYFSGTFQFPENAKTYPTPNLWWAQVSWASIVADVPIQVYDPTDVPFPGVGKKLISIPTPTVANALNVKPICTRSSACPFHAQSLDAAIAAGKPIVLMFATPARCVSRFCGPTLDNVIAASTEFTDRVTFIHCEIFESDETDSYAPGVLTYAIPGEPMMFVANAQGIITTHVSGAIEPSDVRAAILTAL